MSRRRKTATDVALELWARERRRIVGVEHPLTAGEIVGAIRCALGTRRGGHGKGQARWTQPYPELYADKLARAVNAAYWAASPERKWILDVHYVVPGDAKAKVKAAGLSTTVYFGLVREARSFVEGRLSHERKQA